MCVFRDDLPCVFAPICTDGIAKGRTVEERELVRSMLATEANNLRLPMLVLSLSRCTDDNLCDEIQSINVPRASIADNDVLLQEMFSKLESDTARDELLHQLRREFACVRSSETWIAIRSLSPTHPLISRDKSARKCIDRKRLSVVS